MYKPYNKLRHFEEIEKVPAKVYYHYTSLDALFSIVSSRTFRLTSLRSSNDKKEFSYNIERFLTDFSQIIENEQDDNTKDAFSDCKRVLKKMNKPSKEK